MYETLFARHENYRQALYPTCFEGMSVREAAGVMGGTERQASDYLYRGKAALNPAMERRGSLRKRSGRYELVRKLCSHKNAGQPIP